MRSCRIWGGGSQIRGTALRVRHDKGCNILESILASAYVGKVPFLFKYQEP